MQAAASGQPVMMLNPQYCVQAQASASLQPVFARQANLAAAQAIGGHYAAASAVHGVAAPSAAHHPTSPSTPVYYYQY